MGSTSEHSRFIGSSEVKASDETHRKRLLKVIASYDSVVVNQKASQFIDWQEARNTAAEIKRYVLDHLPELLERFEQNATKNGMQVLWAKDVADAHRIVDQIIARHGIRKVVKSKSMTSEELELNEFFEHKGIETLESDLGELIVQLNGEKPYHIVTPAMHKSKEEISEIFQRTLGCEPTTDAEELTDIARRHLRDVYITADLGISGANFLLADDGAILILENEGNARLSTACPKVHLSIAGIEKILPSINDLELFLPLLSTSGTGQQMTAYNSIIRGPRRSSEVDGPEVMYLLLLDNGRSEIYRKPEVRDALSCIRCGACLNACPVYKTVGGHTYNTPYSGPIGAVITPHLKGMRDWGHLAFASSLCGACTDVCPVKIPLHHMLLTNRQEANETAPSVFWQTALKGWALAMQSRFVVDSGARVMRFALRTLSCVAPKLTAKLPQPAAKSFSSWWSRHGE
jgi:L-lactate dehydrogenase complex protein LldF